MSAAIKFFQDGGAFMWPLLLWSILTLAFFFERAWTYLKARKEEGIAQVANELIGKIDGGASTQELLSYCSGLGQLEGEVFTSGVQRYAHMATERRSMEEMRAELNGTVERAAMVYLSHYLSLLQFLASTATLLGLLGTVSGMIKAFQAIAAKGLGEPTIVAAGIAEALITTITGLTIAVPALATFAYFTSKAEGRAIMFEPYGHLVVDALLRRWGKSEAAR